MDLCKTETAHERNPRGRNEIRDNSADRKHFTIRVLCCFVIVILICDTICMFTQHTNLCPKTEDFVAHFFVHQNKHEITPQKSQSNRRFETSLLWMTGPIGIKECDS